MDIDKANERRRRVAKEDEKEIFRKERVESIWACVECGGQIMNRSYLYSSTRLYHCNCTGIAWRVSMKPGIPFESVIPLA